jgi:diacylglycerol kinase (ATP)
VHVLLLHNPGSGDEDHSPESLTATLEGEGHDVTCYLIEEEGWPDALSDRVELVVVAGGDGSVRNVFRRLAESDMTATVIPVGSANNIARSLGIPEVEPARLIRGWRGGRTRPFDVLSLGTSLFVEAAGGGLFADLLVRAARGEGPDVDDKVERSLHLLRAAVAAASTQAWTLELDGTVLSEELLGLELLNSRETGPNVPLAAEADPGDGLIEVALVRPHDRDALADYVEERLAGREPDPLRIDVRRAERLLLRPPPGAPLHLDDELLAPSPEIAAGVAGRLRVLVPADAK